MYAACPFIWVKQLNKTCTIILYKEVWFPLNTNRFSENMRVKHGNFIKDIWRLFTFCTSARILRFIAGIVLFSRQLFWRIEASPVKANIMQTNENEALLHLNSRLYCIFHTPLFSCKTSPSCLEEYLVFKADCNLYAAFSLNSNLSHFKECCNVNRPLRPLKAILSVHTV